MLQVMRENRDSPRRSRPPHTRRLTEEERGAIERIVVKLPEKERIKCRSDLAIAAVFCPNQDYSLLRFELRGYRRPLRVTRTARVDASAKDATGANLKLVLFVDQHDRLYELEAIRFRDGPVLTPLWNTLVAR